eukprot:1247991-Rhodomonas_salina.1
MIAHLCDRRNQHTKLACQRAGACSDACVDAVLQFERACGKRARARARASSDLYESVCSCVTRRCALTSAFLEPSEQRRKREGSKRGRKDGELREGRMGG